MPVKRILKVKYAGKRVTYHEVARHEVAVHEDAGFRKVVGNDFVKDRLNHRRLLFAHRELAVLGNVPLVKEMDFAGKNGLIVFRQHTLATCRLPLHQSVGCGIKKRRRAFLVKHI